MRDYLYIACLVCEYIVTIKSIATILYICVHAQTHTRAHAKYTHTQTHTCTVCFNLPSTF